MLKSQEKRFITKCFRFATLVLFVNLVDILIPYRKAHDDWIFLTYSLISSLLLSGITILCAADSSLLTTHWRIKYIASKLPQHDSRFLRPKKAKDLKQKVVLELTIFILFSFAHLLAKVYIFGADESGSVLFYLWSCGGVALCYGYYLVAVLLEDSEDDKRLAVYVAHCRQRKIYFQGRQLAEP